MGALLFAINVGARFPCTARVSSTCARACRAFEATSPKKKIAMISAAIARGAAYRERIGDPPDAGIGIAGIIGACDVAAARASFASGFPHRIQKLEPG